MVSEQEARTRAEALVRAHCGWWVAPGKRETLRVLHPGGSGAVLLPTLHVRDLHSLTFDGEVVDTSSTRWDQTGVLYTDQTVPTSWGTWGTLYRPGHVIVVEAEVTHGYEEWPAELLGVIEALTQRFAAPPSQYVQVGQVRMATGSDGQPLGGTLSAADRDLLNLYRLPPRP